MRGFLIFTLITIALAAPQYNYNQPQASSQHGHIGGGGGHQAPSVWNKQFSIYSAPEDNDFGGAGNGGQSSARRNLRVVIIRAPENKGLTDAALQLAKSSSSDKTAVYVLTKQTDLGELQNKLAQSHDGHGNKPEVHFVKYRTPEEAEHAQHSIQNQFDQQYQGPTQVSNEGVAPVENYVGSVPSSGGGYGGGFNGGNYGAASVQNTYIPPPAPAPPPPAPIQNTYIPPPSPVVHNQYLPVSY